MFAEFGLDEIRAGFAQLVLTSANLGLDQFWPSVAECALDSTERRDPIGARFDQRKPTKRRCHVGLGASWAGAWLLLPSRPCPASADVAFHCSCGFPAYFVIALALHLVWGRGSSWPSSHANWSSAVRASSECPCPCFVLESASGRDTCVLSSRAFGPVVVDTQGRVLGMSLKMTIGGLRWIFFERSIFLHHWVAGIFGGSGSCQVVHSPHIVSGPLAGEPEVSQTCSDSPRGSDVHRSSQRACVATCTCSVPASRVAAMEFALVLQLCYVQAAHVTDLQRAIQATMGWRNLG